MQLETTKIIDRYLSGELSPADRTAFEARVTSDVKLQKELELQKIVQEAAMSASFRADVKHAARRYRINRIVRWGAAGLGVIAVIIASTVLISSSTDTETSPPIKTATIAVSMMDQLNPNADFDPLPIQYFSVPKEGDVFLSDQSVLLSVPKKAFLLKNKLYTGEAIVQFQEAIQANEIVKASLNTITGDDLLETQGMFSIHAYTPEGEKLEINPDVGVYVQVPVDEYKDGMQLYDYVELENGKTDWRNPRSLSKIPVPVDISELDFYPVGYEDQLDRMKWNRKKTQRDSLYLSFENYCAEQSTQSLTHKSTFQPAHPETQDKTLGRTPIVKSMVVDFPAIDAQFKGGTAAMKTYIQKNTVYPEEAIEKGVSGRVYVGFEVDEYGLISNVKVLKSVDPLLDREAVRVVQKMPRWIPAETSGQYVRTRVRIPINFNLSDVRSQPKRRENGTNLMLGTMTVTSANEMSATTSAASAEYIPQEEAFTVSSDSTVLQDTPCNFPHVAPSNVLAFWNPKFNNTNLATREFERRMTAIHGTCNDDVLKKYTSQLSKPISEIDRDVVNMGYSDFGLFAKEQVGAVNPSNPHLNNIKAFYEKGISSLRERASNDKNWEQSLRSKWDQHLTSTRAKHSLATQKNKEKSQREETAYNQKRTVQKLGLNNQRRANAVAAYPQFQRTIGFTARRSGGYNCDRSTSRIISYQSALRTIQKPEMAQNRKIERIKVSVSVENGTETRETFSVTANGKKRTIAYNSLLFGVKNPEKYDRIMAYALPHQLETYQLLEGENGNYSTSLNDDIIYDICIVGISEGNYFYYQKQTLKGGELGMIELQKTTETKLDASLLQLNAKRNSKAISMLPELSWIKEERKQFKEISRRKEMKAFREKMVGVIYPCYDAKENEVDEAESSSDVNDFGV